MLGTARDRAVLWPPDSGAIADEPVFRIVYLGWEWAELGDTELEENVARLVEERAPARRTYRNGLAFAVPGRAG